MARRSEQNTFTELAEETPREEPRCLPGRAAEPRSRGMTGTTSDQPEVRLSGRNTTKQTQEGKPAGRQQLHRRGSEHGSGS